MHLPATLRRKPTRLELLLGRQRAAQLRRRLGLLALGTGVSLLRPRPRTSTVVNRGVVLGAIVLVMVTRIG